MHQQILFETTQRVFEEAAFALVDEPDETPEPVADAGPVLSAAVEFSGQFSGKLAISAPEEFVKILATNMLGVDEDDPDAQQKCGDALGEILNMVCGNLLPAIAGTEPEFRITEPRELAAEKFRQLIEEHETGLATVIKMYIEGCETELALLPDKKIEVTG